MTTDFISKNGSFFVRFENFNGSGWDEDVKSIIETQLNPIQLNRRAIEESWDSCIVEFDLVKDEIVFLCRLSDKGPNSLILTENITNENKQKLREWATIIAEEVEKLKK